MAPRRGTVRGRALYGLAALLWFGLLVATPEAQLPMPEEVLPLGTPMERPIAAGEAHTWRVTVPPGAVLLVTVEQHSIDIVVEDRVPGGGEPIAVNAGNARWGPEVLLLEVAGEHRIQVRPLEESAWPGRYTILGEALPAADSPRRRALSLMNRAGREALPDTPEAQRKAVATYREALAAWRALRDRAWEAEALACLGVLEARANELQPATEDLLAALALWRELGEPHREADSLNRLGLIYKDTQGTDKARESLKSALALWHRLGERADEAETRGNLCLLELDRGSLPAALSCFQENLAFFHALGVKKEEAGTLHNIGAAYGLLGEPDKALASYEQALALCHALGDGYGEAEALNNIAVVHRTLGEWQEALRLYGEAREVLAPLADRALEATLLNNSGYIYTSVGEHERALAYNVTLCVNGTASCITKPVTIPAAPPVPVISGPANLCNGLTATYSVPIVAGATYSWTVTNGTINGSATGHSVHVTWNATGGGQITVVVTNAKGCSSRATLKVEDCPVWLDKCCVDMKVDAIAPPPQDLGNGVYALAPKVTAPGNTVIRVVADVISTQRTFFSATCGPNGPVSSVVVNASAVSSFTPSFLSSSREVIWHSGPAVNLGAGLTFPFQIQFPPMLSPSCSETLDFCVKYTVTNAGCRSCEIIRCYSILRTGQPVPNDLPN